MRVLIFALGIFLNAQALSSYGEPVRIGAILPLTGETAPFGAELRRGVDRGNSAHAPIEFDDDACQAKQALSAFHRLHTRGVRLFLGPCCTNGMAVVAPLLTKIVEPFFLGVLGEAAKQGVNLKSVYSIFAFELPDILAWEGRSAEGVLYSYPDIPADVPASEYFAALATELFRSAVHECAQDILSRRWVSLQTHAPA